MLIHATTVSLLSTENNGTIVREIPIIFVHVSGPTLWGKMAFQKHLCSLSLQDTFQRSLDVPIWSTQISRGICVLKSGLCNPVQKLEVEALSCWHGLDEIT